MSRNITVTFDDGSTHVYQNAPDDATPDDVTKRASQEFNKAVKSLDGGRSTTPAGQIPADPKMVAPPAISQQRERGKSSLIEKLLGGGEVALTAASAIPASVYGTAAGLSQGMRSGKFGTPEGANIAEKAAAQSMQANMYQPRTEKGKDYLESFGSVMQQATPLIGLPGELAAVASLAKPAYKQAKAQAPYVADAIKPKLDPEIVRLAQAAEKQGIPLRPDMLGSNKFAKVFGNFAETDVPFAGSKAKQRTAAFNQAVIRQIGGDEAATKLTPDVFVGAMEKSGGQIGDIAARTTLASADELVGSLKAVVQQAKPYGRDTHTLVSARANDLSGLVKNGVIDGAEFKKWNTKVLQDIRSGSDVVKQVLGDLQETAMNAFERNIAAEDLPLWKQARQQYAVGKQLIPMVAKSPIGDISPTGLMSALTSGGASKNRMAYGRGGDIGDLAKIGQQFLKEPSFGSLPERVATYGILGAAGSGMLGGIPGLAAGATYGASSLYNLLGPKMASALVRRVPKLGTPPPELTTARGFEPRTYTSGRQTKLGDLTPEWSTSLGAGKPSPEAMSTTGLFPALGDEFRTPARLKSRPQMPMQAGLLGVDDTAVAGRNWVDADPGAIGRVSAAPMAVGGIELSRIIHSPKSAHRTKLLNEFKKRYPEAVKYIDENM